MPPVYRKGAEACVTGVGCFNGSSSWKAPIDSSMRWDAGLESAGQLEIPVMQQATANGIHGFVIHNACWNLLQKASQPSTVSLERLLCVCESLPFPVWSNGISWGHDYGGLLKLDVDRAYSWLERFSGPSIQTMYDLGAMNDPFDGIDFRNMLSTSISQHLGTDGRLAEHADHFSRLPFELRA